MLSTKTAARMLVALVVASLAAIALTATASGADATTIRIWTDKDRLAAVTKVANAWAASKGVTVEVVQKDFGQIRDNLKTVAGRDRPGRHRRRARLDRRAVRQRLDRPAVPVGRDEEAVPGVRARRVLVRHRDQEALRRPGGAREHRARHEHEARQGADDVGAAPDVRRSRRRRRRRPRSASPSSRARAATRTTCTRSSRASAATSSARTPPATSTRRTSASRTRSSSRTPR